MSDTKLLKDSYSKARSGLLIMLFLTVANVLTVIFMKSETVFVFSAALPEIAMSFAMGNYYAQEGKLFIIILAATLLVALLAFYFLCWLFCKKKLAWMIAATVMYAIDCAANVGLLINAFVYVDDPSKEIDLLPTVVTFLFAVWVMYYLVRGVRAGKELQRLKANVSDD